jgi:lipid-A-disaccharide synthase
MTVPSLRLAMVAGEASGDLLAGLLLGGLKQRWPQLAVGGIGGPRMQAQGFDAWWPSDKLAVRGYVEVLRHYREIAGIRRRLAERLLADPPVAFIGVDAPDFNLDLEAKLKAAGMPTIHFVCPSFWAWRGGRVKRLARSADHVLCLFPFEPELLRAHGVRATYVGHPLADAIPLVPPKAAARRALGLRADDGVIALLPGSRRSEIEYIAPVLLQAARLLAARRTGLRFVLPVAPGLRALVEPLVAAHGPAGLALVDGRSHEALAACDLTLIASGTATLEAALFKRPMVITYRMNPLTWQLMKRGRYQPWVGLPNILCGEFVVPELIQEQCAPQALADAALELLDDPAAAQRLERRFHDLHLLLKRDTARCATDAIAQTIGC